MASKCSAPKNKTRWNWEGEGVFVCEVLSRGVPEHFVEGTFHVSLQSAVSGCVDLGLLLSVL